MTSEEWPRDLDNRLREVERAQAVIAAQLQPLLALSQSMTALAAQMADLRTTLSTLKGQVLLLGSIAVVVAPILCGLVLKLVH